ncbi:MAG TPA: recombinase family protein [Streptosporangiaceae bacterium]|nr:recombinase family protein [Streptosporangiaceae bacterium]
MSVTMLEARRAALSPRAGLYNRESKMASKADRDRARSVEQQNEANAEAAQLNGWTVTETYRDPGLSASRFANAKGGSNRQDYRRALADVKAGRIDVLVLWEPSRGDRELESWAHLLNACRARGIKVHVTQHGRTYDPRNGRDWRSLAEDGVDSAYESEKISVRVRRGKADGRMAGRPQGSVAYGVHRVRDPERTVRAWVRDEPDPKTGPVVQEIVRRVGERQSYTAIARSLNERGIPSPTGVLWTRTSVVNVAKNPVYVGANVVTQAESNAARARITETKGRGRGSGERPTAAKFRYSEAMRCAECGSRVKGASRGAGRYYCRGKHDTRAACGTGWVDMREADAWIDSLAITWLSQPAALALLDSADDTGAREALDEAESYEQRIAETTAKCESGDVEPEELALLAAAVKGWTRKAQDARKRAEKLATPSPLAGLPDESYDLVAERWEALTIGARKAAVRIILPKLTLMPGRRGEDVPVQERIIPWPDI